MNNITEGRNPFSEDFRKQLAESLLFTVKCNICDFETYMFEGFNNLRSVNSQLKDHFEQEHKKTLPVGRQL